jgi:parallel beta-helix repeat protein
VTKLRLYAVLAFVVGSCVTVATLPPTDAYFATSVEGVVEVTSGSWVVPSPSPEDPCTGDAPQPNTAYVDDDYSHSVDPPRFDTIKAALKWVDDGYTVRICAGTYRENVEVKNDDLHIIGDGADVTFVKAKDDDEDIFHIKGYDRIEISGLTLKKGDEGIDAKKSSGHNFHDNVLEDNEKGIELDGASDSMVHDNVFTDNKIGVYLTEADGNTVEHNELSGKNYGVYLEKSDHNDLNENHIVDSEKGIYLVKSNGTTVRGNSITGNKYGIYLRLKSGMDATIAENVIRDNKFGFKQVEEGSHAGDVTVAHNDFVDNDHQVQGDKLSQVTWDYGYDCAAPDGGNYWSNVTGADDHSGPGQDKDGSDGILDSSATLTDHAVDNYPFASEGGWSGGYGGTHCGEEDPIVHLEADPSRIPADGASQATITAFVTDETETPVPDGTSITFSTTLGTFTGGVTEIEGTTVGGYASVTLTAGDVPGVAIVTGTVGADSGQLEVELIEVEEAESSPTPGPTEVSPTPTETPTPTEEFLTPTPSETPTPLETPTSTEEPPTPTPSETPTPTEETPTEESPTPTEVTPTSEPTAEESLTPTEDTPTTVPTAPEETPTPTPTG